MNKLLTIAIAALIVAAPVAACAKERPLWAQERTLNAAAPLCVDYRGVYRIRPNGQGNYWLTCNDTTMIRVKIEVVPNTSTVAVAAL